MTFKEKHPVRSKIVIESNVNISYGHDVNNKLNRNQLMYGTIHRTLGNNARRHKNYIL